jgi:hypothetical protein
LKYCDKNGNNKSMVDVKSSYSGVFPMKKILKTSILIICILILPLSNSYAALDGLIYYLYVKGPARVYTPTFEFQGGNDLLVIGASADYGVLNGVWQEAPLGLFSFFWAQVEQDEPTTTTTIPDEIPSPSPLSFQPAQTEQTKFIINLWGLAFSLPPITIPSLIPGEDPTVIVYSMLMGSGDYLSSSGVPFIGFTSTPGPGADPAFVSINPVQGRQEEELTVTITGSNTTFQDSGVDDIVFSPEGITVDSISVQSNTEVRCDITIANDAQIGDYSVTVLYDGGTEFIIGTNVFEVTE